MLDEKIVTLLAEEGKKYKETGEAIASHGRCLVFLPKGVQPGKKVRVRLEGIKEDSRGRMMYRGIPAPDIIEERWKDNGDGTASRVKITIDWLLQESEVGVVETRKLETREGAPMPVRPNLRIIWGGDLDSTQVEKKERQCMPLETERVSNGSLVWVQTGERIEEAGTKFFPAIRLEPGGRFIFGDNPHFLEVNYAPEMEVVPGFFYQEGRSELFISEEGTWGEIPAWVQAEFLARFPVCACGRKRRDAQDSSHGSYTKCQLCMAEEKCGRCGQQLNFVKLINGRVVCPICEPYEAAEQLIAAHFTSEHRQAIAEEAKKLLQGQALDAELGWTALVAGLGHISSDRARNLVLGWW